MVQLVATRAIRNAIKYLQNQRRLADYGLESLPLNEESQGEKYIIDHDEVIKVSRAISEIAKVNDEGKWDEIPPHSLDELLRGSQVHVQRPKPKIEPTSEYKALMARLRRQEETRAYERMINPPLPAETFAQRFPGSNTAKLFPASSADMGEDEEVSLADVNRQVTLILNVMLSIVACGVAIWLVAKHWSTPSRLGLSMTGSLLVGVAEAVVYSGYIRRVKESRAQGKKEIEIKEIIKTWIIGQDGQTDKSITVPSKSSQGNPMRKRTKTIS